ncbi:T9SS type A sorting domain-containing protein, partial [bacterium]|nr:T9SS type A sorting domain-containing protein [bacterium]
DFDTTLYQDVVGTSADWNTADGELKLFPFAPTLVGSYGPVANAISVVVSGDLAFLAGGIDGLVILDITDPANPVLLGTYDTAGVTQSVVVSGDYAFVADADPGMLVIDISDPTSPGLLGTYNPPGSVTDVAVAGDVAFVATLSMLRVVDIGDPTNPTEIGAFNPAGFAFGVFVAGNHAFLAEGSDGLEILDISNPAVPTLVGSYVTPGLARSVVVAGEHAFVTTGSSGLHVIDVRDPANPMLAGSYDTPGSSSGLFVDGDRLFVGDGASGLQVFDIIDPALPTLMATYDTPDLAQDVVVAGEHAFVADRTGLQVLRVREPWAPIFVGFQPTSDTPRDVFVSGDLAFVAATFGGLEVSDISDPAAPALLGSVSLLGDAQGVFVDGECAFVAAGTSGLHMVDVSDPANPFLLGTYDTPGVAEDAFVSGDLAFVADGQSGVQVLDVSVPATPVLLGNYDTPGSCHGIFASGDYVFVTDAALGLLVLDVSDPAHPAFAGNEMTIFAVDVFVSGDHAFVADGPGGLQVLDVSDPASPALLGTYNSPGIATGVRVAGDYAFLAESNGTGGLFVVDISDPTLPTLVGSYTLFGGAEHAVLAGDHVFAANQNGFGLVAYRVFQSDVVTDANVGQSLAVDDANDAIVRARLSTTQTAFVSWEVSANGGVNWQNIGPSGSWISFTSPGSDLRWRSTLNWTPTAAPPSVQGLQIEWLNDFARVTAVTDIPDDQGLQVRVEWARSGHDFLEDPTQIVEYAVYRRVDPALRTPSRGISQPGIRNASVAGQQHAQRMMAAGWDFLMTVPVRVEDDYAVVVPTLADSSIAGGQHFTTFMVSALTATPGVFFDSPPDSGYSVDNLAPSVPINLNLAGGVLSWDAASDPDFDYHTVYGSAAQTLDETATQLGYTVDVVFDVSTTPFAYYHVTTSDAAGNESPPATLGNAVTGALGTFAVPTRFGMATPRPNPFRGATTIRFEVPRDEYVRIGVYDTMGRHVRTVGNGHRAAGRHEVLWDGADDGGSRVGSGVYFVRIEAGAFRAARRVVVLR